MPRAETIDTKRVNVGPKGGFTLENVKTEILTPIPYDSELPTNIKYTFYLPPLYLSCPVIHFSFIPVDAVCWVFRLWSISTMVGFESGQACVAAVATRPSSQPTMRLHLSPKQRKVTIPVAITDTYISRLLCFAVVREGIKY